MSKANKPLFRSAMGGYNKDDVNVYILNENRKFSQIEDEYIDRINELTAKLNESEKRIRELTADCSALPAICEELETLRSKLDNADAERTERDSVINELQLKNEVLIDEKAELESQVTVLNDKCGKLSSYNEDLEAKVKNKDEEITEKEAEIARLRSDLRAVKAENGLSSRNIDNDQISDILARAKDASEEILRKAETGAELILDRARDEARNYRTKTLTDAKEVFDAATEELRRSIVICMNDFVASIKKSGGDFRRAESTVSDCDDDLARRIERMQNELDRAIAAKLAEFDKKN